MGKSKSRKQSSSERFEVEDTLSAEHVAGYLEGIAKGLREGTIALGEQGESFRAEPFGDVDFEVKAKQGKRKASIKLALAFRRKEQDEDDPDEAGDEQAAETESAKAAGTIPDEMSF